MNRLRALQLRSPGWLTVTRLRMFAGVLSFARPKL